MELSQSQKLETKLILSTAMRQSLEILCMPLGELQQYVDKAITDNPLLERSEENYGEEIDTSVYLRNRNESSGHTAEWVGGNQESTLENVAGCSEENFSEMLTEQLLRVKPAKQKFVPLCTFLIYCLDEKGYLRFPLKDLAKEQKVPVRDMAEALRLLQELQPAGVGARDLQECLLLQVERNNLGLDLEEFIKKGLLLLEKRDYKAVEEVMGWPRKKVISYIEKIKELNPIPSQGYRTEPLTEYNIPEAEIKIENNALVIEVNEKAVPRVSYNKSTETLLKESGKAENLKYLKKELGEARTLMEGLENRANTLQHVLSFLVDKQRKFFLEGKPLEPMTMGQLAEELDVSISTISRAIQGKTIIFHGGSITLRSMFSQGVASSEGQNVSANMVIRKIEEIIAAEDRAHPLSDDRLSDILAACGLKVSRRTVTKYREKAGIPTSGKRRK